MNNVVVDYGVEYVCNFDTYITANPEAVATSFTPAAGDTKISTNYGVTFSSTTNTCTFANGIISVVLTATEMQAARILVKFEDQDAALVSDSVIEIFTKNHASAFYTGIDLNTDSSGNVTLAAAQPSITFQPITVTAADAVANITLAGSGTEDGIKWTRSGSGNPFDANIMAQINAEIDTAISDYDPPTNTEMTAAFTEIKGATWATTDTLEAIRDRGDAAWVTATGFATETKQDATDLVIAELTTQGDTNEAKLDTLTTNLATLDTAVDALAIKKNAAFSNFEFLMVLTSDHVSPATGLTVTGERSIDGGAFASVSGAIAEVSNGIYQFDALAADTNGDVITWRFSSATADDAFVTFKTIA